MKAKNKITHHPDREEITQKLNDGVSVRTVHSWLRGKYFPKQKKLVISIPTLQAFRKEVLGIDGQVLKDLQETKRIQDQELEQHYAKQAVQSTNAYKDKLNQIADTRLDVATKIIQMDAIISDRMEFWYNRIKESQDEILPHKADYELRKFMDQQLVMLQQYKKLVEGMADKKIDYNVNITVMNEQILAIQTTIRDLICEEFGAEKAVMFLEKLSNRLTGVEKPKELPATVDVSFEQV